MDQTSATRHADRIRELDESWMEAARRRDLDGMMAIYAPEAYELLPGQPALATPDQYLEFRRAPGRARRMNALLMVFLVAQGDTPGVEGYGY